MVTKWAHRWAKTMGDINLLYAADYYWTLNFNLNTKVHVSKCSCIFPEIAPKFFPLFQHCWTNTFLNFSPESTSLLPKMPFMRNFVGRLCLDVMRRFIDRYVQRRPGRCSGVVLTLQRLMPNSQRRALSVAMTNGRPSRKPMSATDRLAM